MPEHSQKVLYLLGKILPVSLLMLLFFLLGLWLANRIWARARRLSRAYAENEKLILRLSGIMEDQNTLLSSIQPSITAERDKWSMKMLGLENQIEESKGRVSDFDSIRARLEADLESKDKQIESLNDKLDAAEKDRKKEIKGFQADLDSKGDLDSELKLLSAQLADRDREIDSLTKSIGTTGDLQGELGDLKATLVKRDHQIENLERKLEEQDASDKERKEQQAEIADLKHQVAIAGNIKAQLEERDSIIESLKSDLTSHGKMEGQLSTIETTLKQKDKEIALLNDKVAGMGKLEAEIADRDKEIIAIKKDVTAAEKVARKAEKKLEVAASPMGHFTGESVEEDEKLGVVYKKRPSRIDDLKQISGVASVLEKKLHKFGVYRFKQIATWSQEHIDEFSERLSFKDRIDRDWWVNQAADLHREKYGEHLTPIVDIYRKPERKKTATREAGESKPDPAKLAFKGEKVKFDNRMGPVYSSLPDNADDLTRIVGVDAATARMLNNFGVYRFRQIAVWNPQNLEEYTALFDCGDRILEEMWVNQAVDFVFAESGLHLTPQVPIYYKRKAPVKRAVPKNNPFSKKKESKAMSAFKGEAVKEDKQFGVVYTKRPKEIDDLKKISGVAKVLEKELHKFGVYRYKQIAHWTKPVINEFVENLPFGDRVTRDKWVVQARRLHKEKYGKNP